MSAGTLYLVATPIGNLEDVTSRALRILREVARIACEDTRQTRKLLSHHSIHTPTVSFHGYNEGRMLPSLLRALRAGESLALVTDGGTPSISDPGFSLVRAAVEAGIRVIPVPGASAPIAALIASGLPAEPFTFLGFLPHRSGERQRFLEAIRNRKETLIFFDSPRRLARSLEEMLRILGDRQAAVCREMTKVHEDFVRGRLTELAGRFGQEPARGEVTIVVSGEPPVPARPADEVTLRAEVAKRVREDGLSRRDAIRSVARERGISRREVYGAVREPRASDEDEAE